MGKKSPKSPAPPEPSKSLVDEYTPYGSSVYSPITGTDRYSKTISLSPQQQKQMELEQGISYDTTKLGSDQISRIAGSLGTPFSLDGLTSVPTSANGGQIGDAGNIQRGVNLRGSPQLPGVNDFGAERQRVEDATYDRMAKRLDRNFGLGEDRLRNRLANQGIMEGSEAFTNAYDDFTTGRNDAYSSAINDAVLAGSGEQSRLFGLGLSARQQDVGERFNQGNFTNQAQQQQYGQNVQTQQQQFDQSYKNALLAEQARQREIQERSLVRNQPINELAALLGTSGGINLPQFSNNVDMGQLNNANYQGQMNNYNQQVGSNNSAMGSLFGLGGSILGAGLMPGGFLLSDARLKENIAYVCYENGYPVYHWNYIGDSTRYQGVMAQDVQQINPDAVTVMDSGFMAVDYSRIPVEFGRVN